MSPPTISVILPTYNRAACVGRAIRSVLAQTHADLELIVVDDASTDLTGEVLAAFDDPRLRREKNQVNLGVSRSRNRGVELARGAWVAFQDSDDEARIERLSLQLESVRGRDDAVLSLCGDIVLNDYPMSYLGLATSAAIVDATAVVPHRIPGGSCFLVRREAFLALGGFDAELDCFEDWELALRLSNRGSVWFANQPLVIRQKTPGSLFSNQDGFPRNLQRILERHGAQLRAAGSYTFYCNLIGQSLCLQAQLVEGRQWFHRALAARYSLRGLGNLLLSYAGATVFSAYVRIARELRARYAAPVRQALA